MTILSLCGIGFESLLVNGNDISFFNEGLSEISVSVLVFVSSFPEDVPFVVPVFDIATSKFRLLMSSFDFVCPPTQQQIHPNNALFHLYTAIML